jgi:hypothetical protein
MTVAKLSSALVRERLPYRPAQPSIAPLSFCRPAPARRRDHVRSLTSLPRLLPVHAWPRFSTNLKAAGALMDDVRRTSYNDSLVHPRFRPVAWSTWATFLSARRRRNTRSPDSRGCMSGPTRSSTRTGARVATRAKWSIGSPVSQRPLTADKDTISGRPTAIAQKGHRARARYWGR